MPALRRIKPPPFYSFLPSLPPSLPPSAAFVSFQHCTACFPSCQSQHPLTHLFFHTPPPPFLCTCPWRLSPARCAVQKIAFPVLHLMMSTRVPLEGAELQQYLERQQAKKQQAEKQQQQQLQATQVQGQQERKGEAVKEKEREGGGKEQEETQEEGRVEREVEGEERTVKKAGEGREGGGEASSGEWSGSRRECLLAGQLSLAESLLPPSLLPPCMSPASSEEGLWTSGWSQHACSDLSRLQPF